MSVSGGGPESETGAPRKATEQAREQAASFYTFSREREVVTRAQLIVGGLKMPPQKVEERDNNGAIQNFYPLPRKRGWGLLLWTDLTERLPRPV